MKNRQYTQIPMLFNSYQGKFPSTRYQGSKAKLVDWITEYLEKFTFSSCLDAFGGTGVVAYHLKKSGKVVTYNDYLRFNYNFGLALIENKDVILTPQDIGWLTSRHEDIAYPNFIQRTFYDIYFTDSENAWLDQAITNIALLQNHYKLALAFFALSQACIIKRPYNLFHRKNLYVRLADVPRSFGNKTSWDKPFEDWFIYFCEEANQAVFDNGLDHRALNCDVMDIQGEYDLVYIDPPYISNRGVAVDYRDFYHFLEGLTEYSEWDHLIDSRSKHKRLVPEYNIWTDKQAIHQAFDELFEKFRDSILVVSYRSDGIPTESELIGLMRKYKKQVSFEHYGYYKYVLSTNKDSKEIMIIGK